MLLVARRPFTLVLVALLVHAIRARLFSFQAEDGIRDGHVTGVQTCALPISILTSHLPLFRKKENPNRLLSLGWLTRVFSRFTRNFSSFSMYSVVLSFTRSAAFSLFT